MDKNVNALLASLLKATIVVTFERHFSEVDEISAEPIFLKPILHAEGHRPPKPDERHIKSVTGVLNGFYTRNRQLIMEITPCGEDAKRLKREYLKFPFSEVFELLRAKATVPKEMMATA